MRKFILLSLFSIFIVTVSAQTVENVQVEQNGEKLNINYRIGGSTSEQVYFVTLTCSIDGGPVFEPKSVIGDVGANIRGGKSFNTVIWNVFNDVDEVGDVEFFVKVDLISGESLKETRTDIVKQGPRIEPKTVSADFTVPAKTIYVGYAGSLEHPLGIRVATLGNWGAYGHIRYGGYDSWTTFYWLAIEAGVTKRFLYKEKLRLHGYLGVGAGDYLDGFEVDYGVIGVFNNRLTLSLGGTQNPWYADVNIGIGVVF